MRITLARGEMVEALGIASRALSNRSTLPLLSGVLIEAQDGTVTMQATDLEISVKTSVGADVSEPGACVVPGRLVGEIVRSLPEAAVTLSADKQGGTVSCGTATFHIKTLSPDDFPKFPEVDAQTSVELPVKVFVDAVRQVSRAVSRDETRPILTGILTMVEGDTLRMVATDSYRLAVRETKIAGAPGTDVEVVVPGRAMDEVAKLAQGEETVVMGVAHNQVLFEVGPTTFVTRRIEGTFPNYRQLMQQTAETTVEVTKDELGAAVKRVSLLAQHNAPLRVGVRPADKTLSLSAQTQDVGDATEDLMVEAQGEALEIAFNHAFLADGIAAAGTDTVTLRFSSPLKPGTLESSPEEDFLYLLMPVRL